MTVERWNSLRLMMINLDEVLRRCREAGNKIKKECSRSESMNSALAPNDDYYCCNTTRLSYASRRLRIQRPMKSGFLYCCNEECNFESFIIVSKI